MLDQRERWDLEKGQGRRGVVEQEVAEALWFQKSSGALIVLGKGHPPRVTPAQAHTHTHTQVSAQLSITTPLPTRAEGWVDSHELEHTERSRPQ